MIVTTALLAMVMQSAGLSRPYRPWLQAENRFLTLVEEPSQTDLVAGAPKTLVGMGLVDLDCIADGTGRLRECKVILEGPAQHGLGEAALRLTQLYRVVPTDATAAQGKHVSLTIPLGAPGNLATGGCIPPACNIIPPPPPPPPKAKPSTDPS